MAAVTVNLPKTRVAVFPARCIDFRDADYAEEFRALTPPEPESAEPPAAADTSAA